MGRDTVRLESKLTKTHHYSRYNLNDGLQTSVQLISWGLPKACKLTPIEADLMMVQKEQKKSIIEFNGQKTLYPIHLESNPFVS